MQPEMAEATSFTTTKKVSSRGNRYSISIDFPTQGDDAVVENIKLWICELLEADMPKLLNDRTVGRLIQKSYDQYQDNFTTGARSVEIVRSYEDKDVVTYEATITDKDSITWIAQDCASFSKPNGHRLNANDIFSCDEMKIKELMWQFRGSLKMEVAQAADLMVGNVGYIDGWILVIGPAENHNGAIFKIKYSTAEPYLRTTKQGGYYDNSEDI